MGKCKHVLGLPNATKSICPKCEAPIGKACSSTGKVSVQPHKARWNAYRNSIIFVVPHKQDIVSEPYTIPEAWKEPLNE